MLWIGGSVCAVLLLYTRATLHNELAIQAARLRPVVITFWMLTISLNILVTCKHQAIVVLPSNHDIFPVLIVFSIWRVDREMAQFRHQRSGPPRRSGLKTAMLIVAESETIYTLAAIISCTTYASGSNAVYGVSGVVRMGNLASAAR